jgi:hypothetical protein
MNDLLEVQGWSDASVTYATLAFLGKRYSAELHDRHLDLSISPRTMHFNQYVECGECKTVFDNCGIDAARNSGSNS